MHASEETPSYPTSNVQEINAHVPRWKFPPKKQQKSSRVVR